MPKELKNAANIRIPSAAANRAIRTCGQTIAANAAMGAPKTTSATPTLGPVQLNHHTGHSSSNDVCLSQRSQSL